MPILWGDGRRLNGHVFILSLLLLLLLLGVRVAPYWTKQPPNGSSWQPCVCVCLCVCACVCVCTCFIALSQCRNCHHVSEKSALNEVQWAAPVSKIGATGRPQNTPTWKLDGSFVVATARFAIPLAGHRWKFAQEGPFYHAWHTVAGCGCQRKSSRPRKSSC